MYEKALSFATKKHGGQFRKYTEEPYITHPVAVADKFKDDTQRTIAVLHDVVEDTDATFTEIRELFGDEVAIGVWWLTDDVFIDKGNRETRNILKMTRLSKAPRFIKDIKIADMNHNKISINKYDKKFSKVFNAEYNELMKVLEKD